MHMDNAIQGDDSQPDGPRPLSAVADASSTSVEAPRARILVVEDDRSLSTVVKIRLEESGMEVVTVADGVGARWDLLTRRFDAVVLDLGLPDQSGLDVMLEVAAKGELPPVVVLTGAEDADCDLARVLGASHVLQKPCPHWLLMDAIETAISR